MKKLFFVMVALTTALMSISAATSVTVNFNSGRSVEGDLVYRDDSTIVLTSEALDNKELTIKAGPLVKDVRIAGLGRFYVENGRFVADAKAQVKQEKQREQKIHHEQQLKLMAANPNQVIGKAFKNTGTIAMSIGVPSLVAGSILVALGKPGTDYTDPANLPSKEEAEWRGKCAAAGYILMPIGAALTIVGIPMYVHGKQIAEIQVNYTGNGAGIALAF